MGETLTLMCEAEGKPAPQITWYKDGMAVKPSDKVKIAPGGLYITVSLQRSMEGRIVFSFAVLSDTKRWIGRSWNLQMSGRERCWR